MTRQSDIISLASGIVAQHEGFVSKPYLDIANFPTRGYGELLERKVVPKQHRGRRGKYSVQLIKPSYCLLYTSPSPRDRQKSRMPSSA